MTYASVNGLPVVEMTMTIPYLGRIIIDAKIDSGLPLPSSAGGLSVVMGDVTTVATDFRSAPYMGIVTSRSVSGYGGWHKPLSKAIPFNNPGGLLLSYVLSTVASAAGEQVTVAQDGVIGVYYAAPAVAASRTLNLLTRAIWWQDFAGLTHAGPRSGGMITSQFDTTAYDGARGLFEIATDTPSDWLPGAQFSSVNGIETISCVVHESRADSRVRTKVQVLP